MSDWQEKIRIICTYHGDEGTSGYCLSNEQFAQLEKLVQQERVKAQEERSNELLLFLDKLEMKQPEELKTDNWRNWKYIRNSIVDKYELTQSLGEKHED